MEGGKKRKKVPSVHTNSFLKNCTVKPEVNHREKGLRKQILSILRDLVDTYNIGLLG